jgi:hypothetical protein
MCAEKPSIKFISREFSYALRTDFVFFPLDVRDIRDILPKYGYELSPIRGILPNRSMLVAFEGDIARKGDAMVYIDTSNGILGVRGKSNNECISVIDDAIKALRTDLEFDIHSQMKFYEVVANYKIKTQSHPTQTISKTVEKLPLFSKFTEIMGEETGLFSLRLSPKKHVPNSKNWFDIAIEQDVLSSDFYRVGVVYRNPNENKTRDFGSSIEEIISKLIRSMEEE